MGVGYYIFMGFIILFSLITLVYKLYSINVQGKNDLLEDMFNNNDISSDIYKKYKKQINK
jgi:uncharacterized membrane protein